MGMLKILFQSHHGPILTRESNKDRHILTFISIPPWSDSNGHAMIVASNGTWKFQSHHGPILTGKYPNLNHRISKFQSHHGPILT